MRGVCVLARDTPGEAHEPYHVVRVHMEERVPDAFVDWQRWSIAGLGEKRAAELVEKGRRMDAMLAATMSSQQALAARLQARGQRFVSPRVLVCVCRPGCVGGELSGC